MNVSVFGIPEKIKNNRPKTDKQKERQLIDKRQRKRNNEYKYELRFRNYLHCLYYLIFETSLHFVSCSVHFTLLTFSMKTATPQSPSTSRERAKSLPRTTTVIGIRVVFFDHSAPTQREDTRRKLRPHASPAQEAILTRRREPDVAHLFSLRVWWSVVGRSFRVVLPGLLLLLVVLPSSASFGRCCRPPCLKWHCLT